jgi:hypothetical protein
MTPRSLPYPLPILAAFAIAGVLLAGLFVVQPPVLTDLWPFAGTTPMSHVLMAAFLAAGATSVALAVALRRFGALAGVGLDVATSFGPMAVYAGALGLLAGDVRMQVLGVVGAAAFVGGWSLHRRSRGIPPVDSRPMPRPVRSAFVVFVVALLLVGALLVARVPNVAPWNMPAELSTFFGFLFLGSAAYFWFGLRRPAWDNAIGQLAAFLAYDLVMIVPLVQRAPTVPPEQALSLWLYVAVVVGSAFIAAWYLLVDPRWRVWGRGTEALPEATTAS